MRRNLSSRMLVIKFSRSHANIGGAYTPRSLLLLLARATHIYFGSSRTSRSWWIPQSTQHHQRVCYKCILTSRCIEPDGWQRTDGMLWWWTAEMSGLTNFLIQIRSWFFKTQSKSNHNSKIFSNVNSKSK